MVDEKKAPESREDYNISAAIRYACKRKFGVLDSNFLCQSLSILSISPYVSVKHYETLEIAIQTLRDNKTGCLLVLDNNGKLVGIFSERDLVLKVAGQNIDIKTTAIADYMTKDPVCQPPDCTIAYALNLMSHGGFRHLPVIDANDTILGIVSTKDVVDYIVTSFSEDLMQFDTGLEVDTNV